MTVIGSDQDSLHDLLTDTDILINNSHSKVFYFSLRTTCLTLKVIALSDTIILPESRSLFNVNLMALKSLMIYRKSSK